MLKKKSLREIMENKTKFITLRITEKMHKEIKDLANKQCRTLCGQINHILDQYLGKTPTK